MLALLPDFDMERLTIIDQSPAVANHPALIDACKRGATFHQVSVTRENWRSLLNEHLKNGDIVMDLTFGICSIEILGWCQQNNVRYMNTAIERWEDELIPDNNATWVDNGVEDDDWTVTHKELYDRTLYARHQDIANRNFAKDGPSAILEHGNLLPEFHFLHY